MQRLLILAVLLASPGPAQESPSASQILAVYVKALGGAEKVRAVHSRVIRGQMDNSDDGSTSAFEIQAKAPNQYLLAVNVSDQAVARLIFTGDAGWNQDPDGGVHALNQAEVAAARRDYDFYRELRLTELYSGMSAPRKAKFGETDSWLILAETGAGEPEKLWFDAASGLLLSREFQRISLEDGIVNYQEFYDDYREVDGIRMPWKIRRATPDYELTFRYTTVQLNAPVNDAAFAKPSQK